VGGKFQVTNNNTDDEGSPYSSDGKRIAYSGFDGNAYTINVSGRDKTRVTNTDNAEEFAPSWGSRP